MKNIDRHIRRRIKILQERAQVTEQKKKDATKNYSFFFDPNQYTGQDGTMEWPRMMNLAITADMYMRNAGWNPQEYYRQINKAYMENDRNPDVIKNPAAYGINQLDYMPKPEDLANLPQYMREQGFSKDEVKEYQKRIMGLTGYETFQFKDANEKEYMDGYLGPMTANAFMNYQMGNKLKNLNKKHKKWEKNIKKYPNSEYLQNGVYTSTLTNIEVNQANANRFQNTDGSYMTFQQYKDRYWTPETHNVVPKKFSSQDQNDPKQDAEDINQQKKFDVIERIVEARCKAIQRKVM